jgi:hypothetical protein
MAVLVCFDETCPLYFFHEYKLGDISVLCALFNELIICAFFRLSDIEKLLYNQWMRVNFKHVGISSIVIKEISVHYKTTLRPH